jgi:hypothetical protein
MKCFIICLLTLLSWLPAWSQRSSYDPAAKPPAKQGDGFVDFALKQFNPQNKDYGCQIDDARKLLVDETIRSVTSWALLVTLSFLVLSFFLLLQQHRERHRREIIAAGLLAQYHNALAEARSQATEAIRQYNELVNRTNAAVEAALRAASQTPEPAQARTSVATPARDLKPPKPAAAAQPKDKIKTGENGAGRAEAVPQNREVEGDVIAQIGALHQQLRDSHEREKNLQKELMKMQRRMEVAQPKEANITG